METKHEVFDEDRQIEHARQNLVVKDNRLIQNVTRHKYVLSVLQQKCLAYIISKIKPADDVPQWYRVEFDISDFCRVCGINEDSGTNYAHVKQALVDIAEKGFWLDLGDHELYFQWITTPDIFKNEGKVSVDIAPKILPFLCALHERFTQYELWQVLGLKGKYSVMLFELCKSYAHKSPFVVSLDDLYKYFEIEGMYPQYKEFNRRILTPAANEINQYTSIDLQIESIRNGRKITHIRFIVANKEVWDGYEAYRRVTAELNGVKHEPGQLNLFE